MWRSNVSLIFGVLGVALNLTVSKQEAKPQAASIGTSRPVGLLIASFFYAASGAYYLIYPIVVGDPTLWPLYILGGLSVVGSFGVLRMSRWGLWLGLGLFLPQLIAPVFAVITVLSSPGVFQQILSIAFVASLFVLMFFAALTFLLILDKRSDFK